MKFRESIKRLAARVRAMLPILANDGAGIGGAAIFSYGAWLAWHPVGFLVGGALLMAIAWLNGRART